MSESDQDIALTLAEAARVTGRSAEALRARWRRGTLRGFRGNDGKIRVYIDPADRVAGEAAGQSDSAEWPGGRPAERPAEQAKQPDARDAELAELRVRVAAAEAALVEVRAERDRLLVEAERRRWRGIKAWWRKMWEGE